MQLLHFKSVVHVFDYAFSPKNFAAYAYGTISTLETNESHDISEMESFAVEQKQFISSIKSYLPSVNCNRA